MDFDLPDREEIACALATLEVRLARQGQYDGAADVGSAHRLLRAADEEIAALQADRERLDFLLTHGAYVRDDELGARWNVPDRAFIDSMIQESRRCE